MEAPEVKIEVECAHCGNRKLVQLPGQWTPMPLNENNQPFPGPAMPVVLLGCTRCGYVQMFSPQAIKPKPFPERPAQQQGAQQDSGAK
ncbi:hypothetical protein [Symbiobacterium thermophilum]|uniref:Uncharacterized protein n=2 Tax=Symbiobacterium thermophilum TaxID=2734 RepID=Q67NB8_SYMTH|nr:hypothetical protein [Symbiobacterium thermophilum]MBY6276420.1 hypothetical protein [Symbiobacterium thermophilum]OTA41050.1 MAG: hypothetical protein A6D92_10470 [Symbiobacterium thermophilum]BAD40825.1 hypothetical protein STH1840 [Symbiobacterium thermophilum IAM 14863]